MSTNDRARRMAYEMGRASVRAERLRVVFKLAPFRSPEMVTEFQRGRSDEQSRPSLRPQAP